MAGIVVAVVLVLLGYVLLLVFRDRRDRASARDLLDLDGAGGGAAPFRRRDFVLVIARGQTKRPIFRDTATVLKEDTEWLKNLDQTKAT